jgi:hypothetical protein
MENEPLSDEVYITILVYISIYNYIDVCNSSTIRSTSDYKTIPYCKVVSHFIINKLPQLRQ